MESRFRVSQAMFDPGRDDVVAGNGAHLLVLIDDEMARVYRSEPRGQLPRRVIPYDRSGFDRHLHHVAVDARGERATEQGRFYEAIARTIQGAEEILVFACGAGAATATECLLTALLRRSGDLAGRVAGWIVLGEHHLSEDELLAEARAFYAGDGEHGRHNGRAT
jgi:hypothetical protein